MKVVSVSNLKGGVGKTTLSVVLGRHVASMGKKVLLIDADPQGTASLLVPEYLLDEHGLPSLGIQRLIVEYLNNRLESRVVAENICQVEENFYILPNTIESIKHDHELMTRGYHPYFFRVVLKSIPVDFDLVLFDCPPYFSAYTLSSWYAAEYLLIPAEASIQAVPGIDVVFYFIRQYSIATDIAFRRIIIVPTKVKNTKISRSAHEEIKKAFAEFVTEYHIPFTENMNKLFAGQERLANGNLRTRMVLKAVEEIITRLEV